MSPQSTHFHQNLATNTDQKTRPEDEGIHAADKQRYQHSVEQAAEEETHIRQSEETPADDVTDGGEE